MKFSIIALSVATVFVQTAWSAPAPASTGPIAAMTIVPPIPSAPATGSTPAPSVVPRPLTPEEQEDIEEGLQGMEDNAVLEDMVNNGWPRKEAEMVLGLFDAVDTMTDSDMSVPEEEFDTVDALRNSMSQLLSRVGYEYDQINPNQPKVFSRVMSPESADVAAPPPYSRQSMLDVVHGLANLVRTASKLGPFLGNPALAQYAKVLSKVVDMVENVVRSTKNLLPHHI